MRSAVSAGATVCPGLTLQLLACLCLPPYWALSVERACYSCQHGAPPRSLMRAKATSTERLMIRGGKINAEHKHSLECKNSDIHTLKEAENIAGVQRSRTEREAGPSQDHPRGVERQQVNRKAGLPVQHSL